MKKWFPIHENRSDITQPQSGCEFIDNGIDVWYLEAISIVGTKFWVSILNKDHFKCLLGQLMLLILTFWPPFLQIYAMLIYMRVIVRFSCTCILLVVIWLMLKCFMIYAICKGTFLPLPSITIIFNQERMMMTLKMKEMKKRMRMNILMNRMIEFRDHRAVQIKKPRTIVYSNLDQCIDNQSIETAFSILVSLSNQNQTF